MELIVVRYVGAQRAQRSPALPDAEAQTRSRQLWQTSQQECRSVTAVLVLSWTLQGEPDR